MKETEDNEDNENIENNKNDEFIHYHKINIFGEPFVGKTSLISLMENYDSDIFKLEFLSNDDNSYFTSSSMVEEVKQIKINFNEDKDLYFNVYETNLDRFDSVKMNLDTLLLQTDCIIIMWDNNSPKTFGNIPTLISTIENTFKQSDIKVPIFVIQNKMDLKFDNDEISVTKDKFLEYIKELKDDPNIIYKEITLKESKNNFYELIGAIEDKLSENSSKKKVEIYEVKYHHPLKEKDIIKERDSIKIDKNRNMKEEIININCLVLGDQGSGKTSFLKSLIGKEISSVLSSIGINFSTFDCEVKGEKIVFRFQDTAGQERFRAITKSYYRNANAFLLFFDVTNEKSFDSIKYWITSIVENNGKINDEYELFLVANKIDENEKRKVAKNMGKDLANNYNIKYFEISCLKKINIYELLYEITLMSYKKCKSPKRNRINSVKLNSKGIDKNKVKYKNKKNGCCQ